MSSMEQDGLHGSAQSGARQRQLDPQEEAKAASRDALEAQQYAHEAIKRAYMKQMTAQEKAVQASQQVAAQQENCKMAAILAAREAAEKAAHEQKKKSEKEMHETSIAQEAVHNALGSYAGNQVSNHLGPSTFTNQPTQPTGFNANTGQLGTHQFKHKCTKAIQVAREQGEVAQQQMTLASQLAAAAQAPDSAVQAAANLPGLLNKA